MRRDVPRRRVLSDESALAIARSRASDEEALGRVRGLEWKVGGETSRAVLAAVREALALPEELLPDPPRSPKPRGNGERASVVALMSALLRCRARIHRVAPEVLASAEELERMAAGEREGIGVLEGWRRGIAGNDLLALLDGKISLVVRRGEVAVEERKGRG